MNIKKIAKVLLKPLEWHIFGLGLLVVVLLYLQIVICPMVLSLALGAISFAYLEFDTATIIFVCFGVLGFCLGVFWAEAVRRKHGIITFHAYLLSTPEIEGWRDANGKVISRSKFNERSQGV